VPRFEVVVAHGECFGLSEGAEHPSFLVLGAALITSPHVLAHFLGSDVFVEERPRMPAREQEHEKGRRFRPPGADAS
jgi:hypothetical protein